MGVRNCKEIGENLQLIVRRLLANNNLVKLLYYNDVDPLSHNELTEEQKQDEVFGKLIKIVPKVTTQETTNSVVVVKVGNGRQLPDNNEFRRVGIDIEVFVPLTTWVFKNSNLRPFAILGEIQESLQGKKVNGLGKLEGGDFDLQFLTDELGCYRAQYSVVTYD